jgi:hypothetical protein
MADPGETIDARRRAELYTQVVAEGRRRVRRRRLLAAGCAFAVLCGAGGVITSRAVDNSSRSDNRVVISGQPPSTAGSSPDRSCQAGGPIRPGEALTGDSVRFGQLPAGFIAETGTPTYVVASRHGARSATDLTLQLTTGEGSLPKRATSVPVTIQGHPALVNTETPPGSTIPTVTVEWQLNVDATVTLTGTSVSASQALSIARHSLVTSGVPAAPIGDLGQVIPRSAAISLLRPGKHDGVVAWLTTEGDLTAAESAVGRVNSYTDGVPDAVPGMKADHPLWVVVMFSATRPPRSAPGSRAIFPAAISRVIDAETGQLESMGNGSYSAVLSQFSSLVDRGVVAPCPSPPSTDPATLPPTTGSLPYPTGIATLETNVVSASPLPLTDTVELGVGTEAGVAAGDTVTLPFPTADRPGPFVGQVVDTTPTSAEVQLTDSGQFSAAVVLDRAGDLAMAAGNGSPAPLSLDLVNRHLRLRVGQTVSTAGLPYGVFPPGIPLGTIASFKAQKGDRSPTVTLAPAFDPATLTNVEVLLHTGN